MFDELNVTVGGEPFDSFQRFFLGLPGFVGIHAYRLFRRGLTEGGEVLFVIGSACFKFQYRIRIGLEHLLANGLRLIDADAEGGHMLVLREAESQMIVNRFARPPRGAIEQRDINRTFGREIFRRDAVQIIHAARHVGEREPARVNMLQTCDRGIGVFIVARGGRAFAKTRGPAFIG